MGFRFLHISDIHLERSFASTGSHGELARRRRDGLRTALRRAGDAARESHCDAITIGGDLYEHDRATVDTASFLAKLFASWQPIPVFIAPGNHDPVMRGSLYGSTQWPENVHVFERAELTPFPLETGLTLWGLGHDQLSWDGDPLAIDPLHDDGINIALFHGSDITRVPEGKTPHAPFHPADIKARGFAAALTGHYHTRRIDKKTGLVYPGTPEPLAFDDDGARGPVVVDVQGNGKILFTPLDISLWRAFSISCDLSGCTTASDVSDRAIASVQEILAGADPNYALIRVSLEGAVAATATIDLGSMEAHIDDSLPIAGLQILDKTHVDLDALSIAAEASVRGEFSRKMLALVESSGDDEAEIARQALRYGLEALSGVEVGLR